MKTKRVSITKEVEVWDGPDLPYIDPSDETVTFAVNEDNDLFLYYAGCSQMQQSVDEDIEELIKDEINSDEWKPLEVLILMEHV